MPAWIRWGGVTPGGWVRKKDTKDQKSSISQTFQSSHRGRNRVCSCIKCVRINWDGGQPAEHLLCPSAVPIHPSKLRGEFGMDYIFLNFQVFPVRYFFVTFNCFFLIILVRWFRCVCSDPQVHGEFKKKTDFWSKT